jgi:cytochrome P450
LHQHPESLQKVRQEIDDNYHGQPVNNEELKKFSYLKMCINESMRLYPPVWSYGRKSMEEDEIMGIPIPEGSNVNIPVLFLHRNPSYWEKPTEFYPEHFEEEAVKQRDKLAYIPFSAGQHRCIGEYFALVEVQMALIHLIKNYDFRITLPPKIELDLLITIKPKYPISFELTPKTTA